MKGYIILMPIALVLLCVYIYLKIGRIITYFGKDKKEKKWKRVNRIAAVVLIILSGNFLSNIAVIMLHLVAFSAVLDLVGYIIGKIRKGKEQGRIYSIFRFANESGIIAGVLTLVFAVYGITNMYNVVETSYVVNTDKNVGNYKIALLTDVHYDTIQDPAVLKDAIERINKSNPDIVLLGGDIVEEGTSKKRMEEVFELFGQMKNKYGIYYVYGNHDSQPYTNKKSFSTEELEKAITDSGITILEDEHIEINNDLILVGRADGAWGNVKERMPIEELLKDVDKSKYIVVLDHQPVEFTENSKNGVDLELSGHTHAGQIWPVGMINEIGGLNYGKYEEGNCTAIVSSGVAGWKYNFRTGGKCEYVIVNIE